jgi:hypothetical protein
MNKRILELAEQAGITTNLDTDYFEKDINKWVDYYSEKFAELIIRECANITLDYKNHDHYTGWMDHGEEIIRHFGIER